MSDWAEADFEAIFREHYARTLLVVRRVLRSEAQAEEVCAEAFLRLYRAGPEVAATGQAAGWLHRTATRAAIDALRASQRRGVEVELDPDSGSSGSDDDHDGPLTGLLQRERIAGVRAALAALKVDKAQILLLRQAGLSYREIAAAMQINPGSVGTMLARAEAEFSKLYKRRSAVETTARAQSSNQLKTVR